MKQFLKKFLSITLLLSSAAAFADCETSCNTSTNCGTVACYPNRSQSRYKIHQDAGMVGHTNDKSSDEVEGWWGTASATVGYQQTFRSGKIAKSLLGNDLVSSTTTPVTSCNDSCGDNVIMIQGSTVANRNAKAWLADNFYLPTDFNGSFSVSPKIQTFFADLNFYLGLDEWWKGGYVQFSGPIVYTRWNLDYQEQTPTAAGVADHGAGYFTPLALTRADLLANFSEYVQGKSPIAGAGTITQTNTGTSPVPATNTITFQPLNYARMRCDASKETGFADLRMELGWNFWRQEDYHLGANIQAAAPTGNKCCSKYVFDAVVGNGKHWELGGGLTGHYVFYRSEDGEKHFGFYGDLNVTHMFGRSGLHTYDLKNKPNSKYMLAAQFGTNSLAVRGTSTTGVLATQQFAQNYTPVANLTTVNVSVSSAAQIDMIAKFNYTYKNFSFDLGYNLFYRSCQDVDAKSDCDSDCGDALVNLCTSGQENTWALKGDAQMYGFAISTGTTTGAPVVVASQAIPLSATESTATIHGGTNGTNGTVGAFPQTNANIDNAQAAFAGGATPLALVNATAVTTPAINTSIQPVFLSCSDIDMNGTQSMSNTLFGNIQYNFKGDDWTPYLGVGAMVEFGTNSSNCDSSDDCSDNNCSTATASYWGVWVKGGLSFN